MSMQALAEEAEVSVGLVYKYFAGKEDLLLAAIIDANLDAVVLTYRESKTLGAEGRAQIKELEVRTAEPLRLAVRDGIASNLLHEVDVDLAVYDLMMLAHAWALKRWHFAGTFTVEDYIRAQTELLLRALLHPQRITEYRHLVGGSA